MSVPQEVAKALNEAFVRSIPLTQKKRLSEAEWVTSLGAFHRAATAIRDRQKLGVWRRTMATYHFQKMLLASGFAPDVVRKVVFSLILNVFAPGR